MLNDDSLEQFATRCARLYCKRYSCWEQFDDAVGESCLFLLKLKAKGYWETLAPRELTRRTVLRLVRWYQDEHKLRSKNRPTIIAIIDDLEDADDRIERLERDEENLSMIRRAVNNANCVDCLDVILDVVRGERIEDAARKHKMKSSSLRRIYGRFLFELKKAGNIRGVKIVNAEDATEEEKLSCPLLMTLSNQRSGKR